MSTGTNIRRIRKSLGLSSKDLGDMVGMSDVQVRCYENGVRNPKPSTIKKIAEAFGVHPAALQDKEQDVASTMHHLFHCFRQYNGQILSGEEIRQGIEQGSISEEAIYLSFDSLMMFLGSWKDVYDEYKQELLQAEQIPIPKQKAEAILKAEEHFDNWMDIYPTNEPNKKYIDIIDKNQRAIDYMNEHPFNDPEYVLTDEEKKLYEQAIKEIYKKHS